MKLNFVKSMLIAASVAITGVSFTSCEKNKFDSGEGNFDQSATAGALNNGRPCVSIPVNASGIITVSSLSNANNWLLDGVAYVAPGQTLTIDPGTVIVTGATKTYNDPAFGPQTLAGVLVVPKTARLIAQGTAGNPIVFTTPQRVGCSSGTCSTAGQFGGIVVLGRATTNRTTPVRIEGIPQPAGTDITFGGTANNINNDNSGIIEYVRIEYPGYRLAEGNEINGLTLGGVGSGTTLSHIQVSYSADDAFEFFGGTVNADHLVAIGTDDDDFDFDFGYTGTIQYALGLKDPNSTHSTSGGNSDSNGIESDNDGSGSGANPKTNPILVNFTLLGYANNSNLTDLQDGNRWRRATSLNMTRSIIAGFPTGIEYGRTTGITNPSTFVNNVVHGYTDSVEVINTPKPSILFGNINNQSVTLANNFLQLGPTTASNPFYSCSTAASYNPALLIPRSSSPAFGNATTYKGAFQPGQPVWTAGWTDFNPEFCCN
ncbi:hypothetical protein [Parapedobacter tibetensis]|uniref:hypothetical protein n=1 Tax=Parapedobacter tibetensis TaxID=2972951 RepID=UPI00214DDFE8|nr:hypothetical protein [Parapedobacter tibetensis]